MLSLHTSTLCESRDLSGLTCCPSNRQRQAKQSGSDQHSSSRRVAGIDKGGRVGSHMTGPTARYSSMYTCMACCWKGLPRAQWKGAHSVCGCTRLICSIWGAGGRERPEDRYKQTLLTPPFVHATSAQMLATSITAPSRACCVAKHVC